METVGFAQHNHAQCISEGVEAARTVCAEAGLQLTPVRQRVLEILLKQHRAMGAYEILDVLRAEGLGSQPPVAYRALEFLVTHGFAHRIERLNAFVACTHPGQTHAPAFLICRKCESVAETPATATRGPLERAAREAGFVIEETVQEAEGVCPNCAEGPTT